MGVSRVLCQGVCQDCDGEGHVEDPESDHGALVSCNACGGSGRAKCPPHDPEIIGTTHAVCRRCGAERRLRNG